MRFPLGGNPHVFFVWQKYARRRVWRQFHGFEGGEQLLDIPPQARPLSGFSAPLIDGDFASVKPWSDKIPIAMLEKLRKCSYRLLRNDPVTCSLATAGMSTAGMPTAGNLCISIPLRSKCKKRRRSGLQ